MNKLETIQKMYEINEAIQENDMAKVVILSGITDEMIEEMTMPEIFEATSVRLYDMMKTVGIVSD
jgi:hypothetical protein